MIWGAKYFLPEPHWSSVLLLYRSSVGVGLLLRLLAAGQQEEGGAELESPQGGQDGAEARRGAGSQQGQGDGEAVHYGGQETISEAQEGGQSQDKSHLVDVHDVYQSFN